MSSAHPTASAVPSPSCGRVSGHVLVKPRKSGAQWYAKWRQVDGRQVQRRLGPAWTRKGRPPEGFLTERLAKEQLQTILSDARRGTLTVSHTGVTFADAAAEFLRFIADDRGREPSTVADYRGVIDRYLIPRWGERDVTSITEDDVEEYKRELLKGRLSRRTVLRHLVVLNGIYRRARRVWKVQVNPASADLVERPSAKYSGEFASLDAEQLQALVRAASSEQDAALYLTAAMTGLRQGELRALRWRDVDFAADRVHVRRSATVGSNARVKAPKSGKVRSVPMVPDVAQALARLATREAFAGEDDLVFGDAVGAVENDTLLRRRYQRALAAAGLPTVRFHDLRHVFGSTAVREFPLSDVQAMLGHAHITTTMRYVHSRPGADDAQRLARAFGGERVPGRVANTPDSTVTERT